MFEGIEVSWAFPPLRRVPKKTVAERLLGGVVRCAKLAAVSGAVATGVAVAGFVVWKLSVGRRRRVTELDRILAPLDTIVAEGNEYETTLRDCADGELHDEVQEVEEDVELPPVNGGAPVTVKTKRLRKKKIVHTPYDGGVLRGAYLGDVVARARNIYNGGASDGYHKALARAYMVRLMTEHKVRPAHIGNNIDRMVCAVFYKTSVQFTADEMWEAVLERNAIGGATSDKVG